jgi:hypothetical protein
MLIYDHRKCATFDSNDATTEELEGLRKAAGVHCSGKGVLIFGFFTNDEGDLIICLDGAYLLVDVGFYSAKTQPKKG